MGLIARLEHALERFEAEREEQTRREQDASARLAGYEVRLGEPFRVAGRTSTTSSPAHGAARADLAGKSSGSSEPQPSRSVNRLPSHGPGR